MLGLYRAATTLGGPLVRLYLARRRSRGKEDPARFHERLGVASRPRPDGPVVWLHGASVGEALSLLSLLERIRSDFPAVVPLITTGTVTSARLLADRLPEGVIHQYVPVDRPAWVRRFLDHWRPGLAVWAESEFWPNLMTEVSGRGVPMVLVNGRVSPGSMRGWSRFPGLIARLLRGFDLCLAQTDEDAERLRKLGAGVVATAGNLKFAARPLPAAAADLVALRAALGGRPLWLAASTWPGEEDIAWRVHRDLAGDHPGLLTVIVPRHPDRGAAIAEALRADGARVARRAPGEAVTAETDVYLADTMGELGLFFSVAPVAFMGKSLTEDGGQNPLEPARLGCAVVHGPRMTNFADIARRMTAAGASTEVADAAGLTAAVGGFLADPGGAKAAAEAARRFAEAEAGVLDRVMADLAPYLDAMTDKGAAA